MDMENAMPDEVKDQIVDLIGCDYSLKSRLKKTPEICIRYDLTYANLLLI
jgi:hypothetical protein